MRCPHCHGQNTQLACLVYAEGTQQLSSVTRSVFGSVYGSSTTQTRLAAYCAPPQPAATHGPDKVMAIFLMPALLTLLLGSMVCGMSKGLLLLSMYFALVLSPVWGAAMVVKLRRIRRNKVLMPARLDSWRTQWLCKQCGATFHE